MLLADLVIKRSRLYVSIIPDQLCIDKRFLIEGGRLASQTFWRLLGSVLPRSWGGLTGPDWVHKGVLDEGAGQGLLILNLGPLGQALRTDFCKSFCLNSMSVSHLSSCALIILIDIFTCLCLSCLITYLMVKVSWQLTINSEISPFHWVRYFLLFSFSQVIFCCLVIIKPLYLYIRKKILVVTNKQKLFLCPFLYCVRNSRNTVIKNPAYGRQRISRPMRIVGPIQFWRGCVIYLLFFSFFFMGCMI